MSKFNAHGKFRSEMREEERFRRKVEEEIKNFDIEERISKVEEEIEELRRKLIEATR